MSSFSFKLEGQIVSIKQVQSGDYHIAIDYPTRVRFEYADQRPAPVLVRVPRTLSVVGCGLGTEVEIEGECAVSAREWAEKTAFGKETGKRRDVFQYHFLAVSLSIPAVTGPTAPVRGVVGEQS